MDSDERDAFAARLMALFPGRVTQEQIQEWLRAIGDRPYKAAAEALSGYYAAPKSPTHGPVPALPAYLEHLRAKDAIRTPSPTTNRTMWSDIRDCWAAQKPDKADEIRRMTDQEIEARYRRNIEKMKPSVKS